MSTLIFTVRDGEDQDVRADGSEQVWIIQINTLKPLVYKRIGKTTTSISGKSGETRVRGLVLEDTFVIPRIPLNQLSLARDFTNSMIYGYGNPFYLDATDCYGIHRPFYGVVVDDMVPISNEGCTEWSMSVAFREVPAP